MTLRKKKTEIDLHICDIREDGYHIFVYLKINGNYARMLVDTGASRTVFDIQALEEMQNGILLELNEDHATGLGSNAVENYIVIVDEISIGGTLKINEYQAGALDLQHVNLSYQSLGMPAIIGVLGSDILFKYDAIIDFGKGVLKLYS
jgi:predicted aspartyl protease